VRAAGPPVVPQSAAIRSRLLSLTAWRNPVTAEEAVLAGFTAPAPPDAALPPPQAASTSVAANHRRLITFSLAGRVLACETKPLQGRGQ